MAVPVRVRNPVRVVKKKPAGNKGKPKGEDPNAPKRNDGEDPNAPKKNDGDDPNAPKKTNDADQPGWFSRNKSGLLAAGGVLGLMGMFTGMAFLPQKALEGLSNMMFGFLPEETRPYACSSCCCSCCLSCIAAIVLGIFYSMRS